MARANQLSRRAARAKLPRTAAPAPVAGGSSRMSAPTPGAEAASIGATDYQNRKASEPVDQPGSPSLGVVRLVEAPGLVVKLAPGHPSEVCHQDLVGSQTDIFAEQLADIIAEQ